MRLSVIKLDDNWGVLESKAWVCIHGCCVNGVLVRERLYVPVLSIAWFLTTLW